MCWQIIYLIYMYKPDLALNNVKELICHKTQQKKTYQIFFGQIVRLFKRLVSFERVVWGHPTQPGILLGVQYLAIRLQLVSYC